MRIRDVPRFKQLWHSWQKSLHFRLGVLACRRQWLFCTPAPSVMFPLAVWHIASFALVSAVCRGARQSVCLLAIARCPLGALCTVATADCRLCHEAISHYTVSHRVTLCHSHASFFIDTRPVHIATIISCIYMYLRHLHPRLPLIPSVRIRLAGHSTFVQYINASLISFDITPFFVCVTCPHQPTPF